MAAVQGSQTPFHWELHVKHILKLDENKESIEHLFSEHLRMGAVYWGVTALALMGRLTPDHKARVADFVQTCRNQDGSYSPNVNQDAHITSTHYAVLLLSVCGAMERLDGAARDATAKWVAALQTSEGSFRGDAWGEVDTRFSYCGLAVATLLDRAGFVDADRAAEYVLRCLNHDGSFGSVPAAESHAAYVFCCVSALALAERLHELDRDALGWWLCERQTVGGGFNGRPEKAPDVCYSWWILSALHTIGRMEWIDKAALANFILASQDDRDGGIADRPDDVADVFHTFFGIAGLSLLGAVPGVNQVHPVYAMPSEVVEALGLPPLTCADW